MKALVFNGPGQIRYESFDDPTIEDPRNLIIQVQRCSICGTDLHMLHGGQVAGHDYSKPMKRFCTGHETIGEVVEVGSGVSNHKVGDRILVSGVVGCGRCRMCQLGKTSQCEAPPGEGTDYYGLSERLQGGQAEYLQVRNADFGAVAIPDGVSDEQAILLTDALSTGYFGVKKANISPGDTVAVIGQGPVGLMAAEAAMAVGASRVYTIDPDEGRRNMGLAFGGTPLAPNEAAHRIAEDTHGLGVHAVIEAVGINATLTQAAEIVRPGGNIAILGVLQADSLVPLHMTQYKNVNVFAGLTNLMDNFPELVPLVQMGKIKGEGVFSHHFKLSEGEEAYRIFNALEDGVLKVMMTP